MKKVFSLFVKVFSIFTFLLASTVTFSQEINELDFLTSGKWFLESVQIGDQTQEFSKGNSWMAFHADGKYEIMMSENEQKGNWKFDENEKAIQFQDAENLVAGFKIKTLNENQLFVVASEGDVAYTMKLKR